MLRNESVHIEVYQVLDGVLAARSLIPGAQGQMFGVIDRLRDLGPGDELRLAEIISLSLYKLQGALFARSETQVDIELAQLRSHAAEWLQHRIASHAPNATAELAS